MPSVDWREVARRKAKKYGLDPDIFDRQINAESGYAEDVITGRRASSAGAQGIAQIMPDTARGWGVDPLDPDAALDAAARNMAKYVKNYGGDYEKALAAYNAGPGAVAKYGGVPPFEETRNYVTKILQGQSPRPSTSTRVDDRMSLGRLSGTTQDAPNELSVFDVIRRMNESQKPEEEPDDGGLRQTVETLKRIKEPSPRLVSPVATPSTPTGAQPVGPPSRGGSSDIYELFHDPVGGWDKGVNIGPIGGHQHVHVAAEKRRVKWILDQARRRFGLTVKEHPAFDTVDPVHTGGSHHYKEEAGDVSGDPQKELAFVDWIRKKYRLK